MCHERLKVLFGHEYRCGLRASREKAPEFKSRCRQLEVQEPPSPRSVSA